MRIAVLGSGMYVTGRGQSTHGTILGSLFQMTKENSISEVSVIYRSSTSLDEIHKCNDNLSEKLKIRCQTNNIQLGADSLSSFTEILRKSKFDAVIISVPDHLHYDYCKAAILSKTPVLVVKPFVTKQEQAKELAELSKELDVYGAVEFHKRWDATNLYIKKIIKEGRLGDLSFLQVDYSQKISIPLTTFKGWSDKSNIFQYLGVHYVDLFYFLTGFIPIKVLAIGTNGILKEKGIQAFDSVHVDLIWKSTSDSSKEVLTRYDTSWIDPDNTTAMSDQRYKLIGTKGRIDCNQKNRGLEEVSESHGVVSANPYFSDFFENPDGEVEFQGYGHDSIKSFITDIKSLMNKKVTLDHLIKTRPSFEQSIISSAVVEAANKSLANGFNWVKIEL
ncbi:MAG: putative dehydrogenase [Sphingobacteriales bacterium]|jgi:predicted dehydrogenase